MKKNRISKNWLNKQRRDIYTKESKEKGYRSRSAIKLIEIDNKFNIFENTKLFLDLGAAPGGWSQVASKKIRNGKILSVDIKDMSPIKNTTFLRGNIDNIDTQSEIMKFFNSKIDLIVSDMASNTTGNKNLDSLRTGNLCLNAIEFSEKILKPNGIFISKIFMGSTFKEIQLKAQSVFENVSIFKPKSSKKESKEIYFFCKNKKF